LFLGIYLRVFDVNYIIGKDMRFKVRIECDEDGWHVATAPALPGCISQGKTEAEARKNIKEAIKLHLSSLAEEGIPIQPKSHVKEVTVTVTA